MSKIAIVTDSTAYIPNELSRDYPIHVIPLQVIWDQQVFADGIDIQPDEFYARLKNSKTMPTTSQPTPAAFEKTYKQLIDQDYEILSMHISAKLSGTIDSAMQAREHVDKKRVEIVDSFSTSMGLGFPVMAVARAAADGATLQDCKALAEKARDHTGLFFLLNTLEFLHRGGRIGGAAAFVGTALNLKPILHIHEGAIVAAGKVRTWKNAVDRLIELVMQKIGNERPIHLAGLYSDTPDESKLVLDRVRSYYGSTDVIESTVTIVSPVLGVHVGPGAVGLIYMSGI